MLTTGRPSTFSLNQRSIVHSAVIAFLVTITTVFTGFPARAATPAPEDFTISLAPADLVVFPGTHADLTATIARGRRFNRSIALRVSSSNPAVQVSVLTQRRDRAVIRVTVMERTDASVVSVTVLATAGQRRRQSLTRIHIPFVDRTTTTSDIPSANGAPPTTNPPPSTLGVPTKYFIMDAAFSFTQVGPGGTATVTLTMESGYEAAEIELIPSPAVKSAVPTGREGPRRTMDVSFSTETTGRVLVGFRARLGSAAAEAFAPIAVDPKPFVQIDDIRVPYANFTFRSVFRLTEVSAVPRPEYTVEGYLPNIRARVERGECTTSAPPTVCQETLILTLPNPFPSPGTFNAVLVATTPAGSFRYPFTITLLNTYR